MSDLQDQEIRRAVTELRSLGTGSHRHLNEIITDDVPSIGDPSWVAIARRAAEITLDGPGRFIVAVPLGSSATLPRDVVISSIAALDASEPPAIYLVVEQESPRTWFGEYYRLDLAESSNDLLCYLSAYRDRDALTQNEEFRVTLYFETRR